MSGSSKGKKNRWYGYLEAGASSSPVMRDNGLDTGSPKTVFLFNLVRGRILEYSREIVEPKLRELNGKESQFIAKLDTGYAEARRNFRNRSPRILNIPERGGARRPASPEIDDAEFAGFGRDDSADESWLDAQVE
ncbi:MAG: hypothetical protein PVI91_00165 [Gammaproteobacteria bacterium]|jgi:hypothetical protein